MHLSCTQTYIQEIIKRTNNFNPLVLGKGGLFWKLDARKQIKKAQIVLFFVGELSYSSKYIGWELEEAIKYNKQVIIIKLGINNESHNVLSQRDNFSRKSKLYGKIKSLDELIEMVNKHENGEYALFNSSYTDEDKSILLEQYKLFLETSEALVDRRQKVSNFFITANALIVSLSGTVMTLSIDNKLKMIAGALLSIVGIILSISWMNLLTNYGKLNSSKMKIISMIEKQLPAAIFDTEWAVLSDSLNNKKYISFTENEKRVPKTFIAIYILVILAVILASIMMNS